MAPGRVSLAAACVRVALASLAALTSTGCQSKLMRPSPAPDAPAPADRASTPGLVKSDFQSKVGPQQQYNVHIEMARVHESQGSNEAAIAEYQKALEVGDQKGSRLAGATLGPAQQALAERRMAAAYDRMGRFAQAEVHYSKALKLAPADPKVWNDAGYSFYLQNRLDDAERSLQTAASIDPNNSRVQTNLGLAHAAAGKTEEALAALSRAGGEAVGHANLGYILAAMGRNDEARTHYEAALGLQPDLAAARQALVAIDSQSKARATALATNTPPARTSSNVVRTSTPNLPPAPVTGTVASTPIVGPDDVVPASAARSIAETAPAIAAPTPIEIKEVPVVATPPPIELEIVTPSPPPSSSASAPIPEWALPPSVRHDTPLYVDPTSVTEGPRAAITAPAPEPIATAAMEPTSDDGTPSLVAPDLGAVSPEAIVVADASRVELDVVDRPATADPSVALPTDHVILSDALLPGPLNESTVSAASSGEAVPGFSRALTPPSPLAIAASAAARPAARRRTNDDRVVRASSAPNGDHPRSVPSNPKPPTPW